MRVACAGQRREAHWLWNSASSGRPWRRKHASYVMLASAGMRSPGIRPAVGHSTSCCFLAGVFRANRQAGMLAPCANAVLRVSCRRPAACCFIAGTCPGLMFHWKRRHTDAVWREYGPCWQHRSCLPAHAVQGSERMVPVGALARCGSVMIMSVATGMVVEAG